MSDRKGRPSDAATKRDGGRKRPAGPSTALRDYLLSLPERTVRSAAAVSAGILRTVGDTALPSAMRRTNLYRQLVEGTLRYLIETVGGVEGTYPDARPVDADYAVRRAAGNGIELAGILAFRASPVWVMAVLADLSGAGRTLVREIADGLKQEGLLDPEAEFVSVDEILEGLERTSGRVAGAINAPPLDLAGLRREWAAIRAEAARIPPSRRPPIASLEALWTQLRAEAESQGISTFRLSAAMAVSAVQSLPAGARWLSRSSVTAARRGGGLVADALLEHYRAQLVAIRAEGFPAYGARQFGPYLRGAAAQFHPRRGTLTASLLRRLGRDRSPPEGRDDGSTTGRRR